MCAPSHGYTNLPRMGECMYKETEAVRIFFLHKMHVKVTGVSPEDQSDLLRPECAH
jgi:hypothetical protein